jgi:hypothetical protein
LRPVLILRPDQRLDPVTRRVRELATDLARSPMSSSRAALELQDELGAFCLESAPRTLELSPVARPAGWISSHD